MKQTLSKSERLHDRKSINILFNYGEKKYLSGFIFYTAFINRPISDNTKVKLFVIIQKRLFKRAVDRNKIKRIIREIFRKDKILFSEWSILNDKQLLLGILYTGKKIPEYTYSEKIINNYIKTLISSV